MKLTRQQQLLSLIKRIVSTELRELNHEQFHAVVVTYVHLSNSGQDCRVFVEAPDDTIRLLNTQYHGEIQHRFMKKFVRKIVPKLQFLPDPGLDQRMEEILAEEDHV